MMIVLACVLSAALYAHGVHHASRWPWWRAAAFAGGLVTLAVALGPPLHARAEEQLSPHMLQHLLLTLVAAPLLVLGAPIALALRALRGSARRDLGRVVSSRAARALVHPLAGWCALALTTVATHMTGLYDLALRDPLVHVGEHLVFLAGALIWWTSLVGVVPGHSELGPLGRLMWVMAAMPIMAGVGAWLAESSVVRYAAYAGPGALADQRNAGSMMWGLGTLPMAIGAFALALEGLLREERRQRRREAVRA